MDVRSLCHNSVTLIIIFAALRLLPSIAAQRHSIPLPKFEDYPVKEYFNGTPHAPILQTQEQHRYRTRIREGVEKGWGARINGTGNEQNRPGPNFAGHYVVIVWGCGAPCLMMAVCDVATGAVYNPPISATHGLGSPLLVSENSVGRDADVEYRLDSRLMIVTATPHYWNRSAESYSFYFVLQDNHWKLIRRVPITDEQ
jgi:hypothetical protein